MRFKLVEQFDDRIHRHGTSGAHNVYGYMFNDIRFDESKIIESCGQLREAIVGSIDKDKKGEMIVLSTDVNAVKQSDNKIIDWIKKKLSTMQNRLSYKKMIDKVAKKHEDIFAWTIGKFLNGRYKSNNGKVFDENSISIELLGVSNDTLIKFAEELCDDFKQESVLVKDYQNNEIVFVDGE